MKPDWDKLAEEAHSSVFIADVNCSDEPELCESNGVAGYPTIKVHKDGSEDKYNGPRGFEELKEYVDENLAIKCDVNNMTAATCSEKAQTYAAKWKDKSAADVDKEVKRLSGMMDKSMTRELKTWLRERLNILQQYKALA
jgi:thioredoxin-like negative regulator of GroEL